MAGRNRQNRADTDVSASVDHYSVQAALPLAMVSLVVLAAVWPRGRRQLGVYVAVCAGCFGVLSLGWPGYPGAVERGWAVASVVWGAGVAGWALLPPRSR